MLNNTDFLLTPPLQNWRNINNSFTLNVCDMSCPDKFLLFNTFQRSIPQTVSVNGYENIYTKYFLLIYLQ